jgi:hypothetical protein
LDKNYSNLNNKCVYIGELIMDNDADSLLMKENLDEVENINIIFKIIDN